MIWEGIALIGTKKSVSLFRSTLAPLRPGWLVLLLINYEAMTWESQKKAPKCDLISDIPWLLISQSCFQFSFSPQCHLEIYFFPWWWGMCARLSLITAPGCIACCLSSVSFRAPFNSVGLERGKKDQQRMTRNLMKRIEFYRGGKR